MSVQVRSLTLDVRIWDEAVLGMMERIGNDVANQAWEAELVNENARSGFDSFDSKRRERAACASFARENVPCCANRVFLQKGAGMQQESLGISARILCIHMTPARGVQR